MVAKQGRGGRQSSGTRRFCALSACVRAEEPQFLWLAPGSRVRLFPADKRWLPSPSPPALPVVLLNCQQQRSVFFFFFTQQASGVNEHTCANLTLGGWQTKEQGTLGKSFPPGETEAEDQRGTSPDLRSPSFTLQAQRPPDKQTSDLYPCGWIEGAGQSDTSCQDTLSSVASVLFTRPAAFSSMADHFSMRDEPVCRCRRLTRRGRR